MYHVGISAGAKGCVEKERLGQLSTRAFLMAITHDYWMTSRDKRPSTRFMQARCLLESATASPEPREALSCTRFLASVA